MKSCHEIGPWLEPYSRGEADDAGAIRSHLRGCADCRAELEWIGRVSALLETGLRRTAPRRGSWWLSAAAVVVAAGLLIVLLWPGGSRVEGRLERESGGTWVPVAGLPDDGLVRAVGAAALLLDDGTRLDLDDRSVIALGRGDVCATLRSGRVRARLATGRRLRLPPPAGEVRGGDFEARIEGDETMSRTVIVVLVLSGAAVVEAEGGPRELRAGEEFRTQAKDELTVLVERHAKALRDGDSKAKIETLNKLVAAGEKVLDHVRAVAAAAKERNAEAMEKLGRQEEEIVRAHGEETEKKLRELYTPARPMLDEMRGLEELLVELPLRWRLRRGEAVLDSPEFAVRSLEALGNTGNWKAAAACVTGGDEASARELHRKLSEAASGTKGPAQWKSTIANNGTASCTAVVLTWRTSYDGRHTLEARWDAKGVFTWTDASGVAKLAERDGSWRIERIETGASIDPGK